MLPRLCSALRTNKTHILAFLPSDGSKGLITGEFFLTSRAEPQLESWLRDYPEWGGYALVFEEVDPHD